MRLAEHLLHDRSHAVALVEANRVGVVDQHRQAEVVDPSGGELRLRALDQPPADTRAPLGKAARGR